MTREPYASHVVHYILDYCRRSPDEAEERLLGALAELHAFGLSPDEIDDIDHRVREGLAATFLCEAVSLG